MPDNNDSFPTGDPFLSSDDLDEPKPTSQSILKPKKSKKPLAIILVIIGLLLLAGVGAAYYFFFMPKTNTEQTVAAPEVKETAAPPSQTTNEVIASIKESLAGSNVTGRDPSNRPFAFAINDNKYLTYADEGSITSGVSSVVSTQTELNQEVTYTEAALAKNGLIRNGLSDVEIEFVGSVSFWTSKDLVCQVLATPDDDGAVYDSETQAYTYGSYSLIATCAYLSDYSTTATTAKPFYDAYKLESDTYKDYMVFVSQPKIKDSATEGYKTASIPLTGYGGYVGGFAALFYQTPDTSWHYFIATQSVLMCAEYNTNDLKKAYVGEQCYDEANETAVVTL